ncbi:MAG: hypothetical protein JNM63_10515 [Spirochaetia bacterium]|nr:hypothetical protein [Spirochaetia bacterium]
MIWKFLMTPASLVNQQPSVQKIDDKAGNKNLAEDDSAYFLTMSPKKAADYLVPFENSDR